MKKLILFALITLSLSVQGQSKLVEVVEEIPNQDGIGYQSIPSEGTYYCYEDGMGNHVIFSNEYWRFSHITAAEFADAHDIWDEFLMVDGEVVASRKDFENINSFFEVLSEYF